MRQLVSVVYAVYLFAIVVALLHGGLPLAETVMVCLAIHLLGVAGGLLLIPDFVTYPRELDEWRDYIIALDIVQLVVFVNLANARHDSFVAHLAAAVALVGIVGCFYKAHVTETFWRTASFKLVHD